MIAVTLYTKEGCTLCDEVKAELAALAAADPALAVRLTEVDITTDVDLFARYRFLIPVVETAHGRLLAPIYREQLARLLQSG